MPTFGPQLIGETEKTLGAILRRNLDGTGLTEPEWVTLRLAAQNERRGDLATLVADRAHFPDAEALVAALTDRGLVADGTATDDGRALMAVVWQRTETTSGPIWDGLPADDVAATERVLNALIDRGREVISAYR
ncbi:MarR family transcriptional regulator [Nocardioides sp. CER19]|uniref:helix-turn-helix domain-containing protein n=1 Tax=Nocardioides sp. CER19 TaxID=3038538 RepID=UPI002449AB54|nr:MarR family transcriptional regulator [Nocardioides sp. CER19]MDH2414232.1 MarR family transcriptional regulator [Nocardioides sp. CER19]